MKFDDGDIENYVRRFRLKLDGQKERRELCIGQRVDALCAHVDEVLSSLSIKHCRIFSVEMLGGEYIPAVVTSIIKSSDSDGDYSTEDDPSKWQYLVHFQWSELLEKFGVGGNESRHVDYICWYSAVNFTPCSLTSLISVTSLIFNDIILFVAFVNL